ncbi:major facilitator superfamily domain-containing protein [Phaeosphaeria sp. MPI-PUGE-AT-0046c]|nr:major facilitator superfamily domain-containing protein [Phaeosphaeria sp. MPI-PUGE-AT-0046c]
MENKMLSKAIVSSKDLNSRPSSTSSTQESQTTPITNVDAEKAPTTENPPPYSAFSHSRQWCIVLIVTAAGFFSPLTGAVYLPSLVLFEAVFKTSSTVINASVSVYWAVFGIAPMFGATLSDYGGRKTIYVGSLAIYLVANSLLAALPPTVGGLFALRVFQAIGSSMVTSIGAGTVADVTEPAKRASRIGLFLLGPQLGPLLGPLIGGQFSHENTWRWVFGFLSVACLPVYILILFFLPETLRCLVGNGTIYANSSWLVMPRLRQKQLVQDGLYPKPPRPTLKSVFHVLAFIPNCIVSFTSAFNFAGLSAMYVVFPRVWQTRYGWDGSETGYAYLAPGVAMTCASFAIGRLGDILYRRYKAKHNGENPPPERRLDTQMYAYVIAAAGKVMFGWFVARKFHPAAGLAASALAASGAGIIMVSSTSYQTECMPTSTAALIALSSLLRNIGAAIAAAIMDSILDAMGYGWCFTGLAILDLLCIGGLLFIRLRGHLYREKLTRSSK